MSLLTTLIYVGIIFFVIRLARKGYKNQANSRQIQQNSPQNNTYQNNAQNSTYQNKYDASVSKNNTQASSYSNSYTPIKKTADEKKPTDGEKMSTTDYLEQKAMNDVKQHEEEKRNHQIRMKKQYGNAKVGQRYMLGDEIPRGMYLVPCGYCGADNLLSPGPKQECLCYFCRKEL